MIAWVPYDHDAVSATSAVSYSSDSNVTSATTELQIVYCDEVYVFESDDADTDDAETADTERPCRRGRRRSSLSSGPDGPRGFRHPQNVAQKAGTYG